MATKRPHGSIAPETTTAGSGPKRIIATAEKTKKKDLLADSVVNSTKDEPAPAETSAAAKDNTVNDKKNTSRVRKKKRKKAQQQQETLAKLAQDAQFTNSVILVRNNHNNSNNNNNPSSIPPTQMTCTTCSTPPTKSQLLALQTQRKLQPNSSCVQIYTQPLLVLDLNGILCHRIRPKDNNKYLTPKYRSASCFVAGTPVIPRPELSTLLTTLDAHFCLAVWTSAQPKTAKKLVQELFPPEIASRLLFVWGQNRCKVVNDNTDDNSDNDSNKEDNETLFVKELDKVWKEYPLWNQYNTLLIDDSPDKCPFSKNALHPPPMNGQQRQGDEDNHALQMAFFDKLVTFWTRSHSLTASWDELGDVAYQAQPEAIWAFLGEHAINHMGWRIE